MRPEKRIIHSQDSWVISNDTVELGITEYGGNMAPVHFYRDSDRSIQPYYIHPWADESLLIEEPVLRTLRGDFFCLPFGGDNKDGDKDHRAHGETSYGRWEFSSSDKQKELTVLELTMDTEIRRGRVTKRITLADRQNCVYIQHRLEGFEGRMPLGHHATLHVPDTEGAMRISTSPLKFGITNPLVPGYYFDGEYCSLQAGERFRSLSEVPTIWKEHPVTDCSSFPRREGFVDILQVFAEESSEPAWTAVAVPSEGYLWFSLKDQALLPSTVFWMENHGRHQSPWKGRNRSLGIEDVCAYFAAGLHDSVEENMINREGIPTSVDLSPDEAVTVNYIEGVVKIPAAFDRVRSVSFGEQSISFHADSGYSVTADVHYDFLSTGEVGKKE